jgi:hypothetical protein
VIASLRGPDEPAPDVLRRQACAREALTAGARVALVEPTPDTVAFYRLLGFALRAWPRDRSFYLPLPRG